MAQGAHRVKCDHFLDAHVQLAGAFGKQENFATSDEKTAEENTGQFYLKIYLLCFYFTL